MGATLGGAAALGSLGTGIAGLFGAGAQAPSQFDIPNMGASANNAYSGIGSLGNYNTYAPNIGQVQGITSGLVNNPYSGQFQQGANAASQLGGVGALNAFNTGGNLQGASGAVLNTAFDPQNQLYNQQLALTQSQQNAANAQAGVGTTPYGAGLQDQNLQNFNIAWQNNQLGRETQGLQAAGQGYQTGAGLQTQGANQYLQSQQMPYNTYGQIGSGQIGALNTLGQFGQSAAQLPQQQIGDYLSYLGVGNQANSVANQQAQVASQLQNQYMSQIGAGLSGLGGAYGGFGGGYGGLSFSPSYAGNTSLPAD